jgi:hypothetical protein
MSNVSEKNKAASERGLLYRLKHGPLTCIFCKETFMSFKDLWVHFLRHCST